MDITQWEMLIHYALTLIPNNKAKQSKTYIEKKQIYQYKNWSQKRKPILPLVGNLHIRPGELRMQAVGMAHRHSAASPPECLSAAEDNTDGRLGCVC